MRVHRRFRPLSVVAGLTLASVAPAAQTAPPGRAGDRLIVRVVRGGEPVTDLKKEEIAVKTDGRERVIRDLTMIRASGDSSGASAPAAPTLSPPFAVTAAASPAWEGARQFVILLDEEGIAPGREEPVRRALGHLVSRASPTDRIGLLSLRIGGASLSPTSEHGSVTSAVGRIVGGNSASESAGDLACRTKRALDSLGAVFREAPPGRTIVLVSSGMAPMSVQRMATMQEQTSEVCQIRSTDFDQLSTAAARSAANLYVLYYPDGLANTANISTGQQGLENVTGAASGESIRVTGDSESAVARVLRETAAYYVATLDEVAASPVRNVQATVNREGVRSQVRPAGVRSDAAPASAKGMAPRDMMKSPAVFAEVPLRATGFISRQGASEMKVVTLFEPLDPTVKITAASVGVVDEKGSMKLWSAKPADLERSPLTAPVTVAPGRYRVRAAVTTDSGAGGTVDYTLIAALEEAGPIRMSRMFLGTAAKGFVPKLQFSSQDSMAVGLLELYSVPQGASVSVKFEIVENETAAPLGETQGTVGAGAGEDARIAYGGFGITTLQPGDYIMRATISLDGKVVGKTIRTLRKVN